MRILVMGATGYIGGRLVPRLVAEGHSLRCLTRRPEALGAVDWAGDVDVRKGDALDRESLEPAMADIDVVYYLVHSIGSGAGFEDADRQAALNTAAAADHAGVERIVYLGGLIPQDEDVSVHLASRAEVGQIFLDGKVPAIVLQAGIVIGSGSASFEMLRYLTERLPVMVTPKWVDSRTQPIAVRDVLSYLIGVLEAPRNTNRRFDVGGPDVLTYRELMQRYAAVAGLRPRIIVPVPVLSPRLSSHWVNVVTPVPKVIAQPLIESLRNSVVVREHDIDAVVPLETVPFDRAVRLALQKVRDADVVTRWSGAEWPGAPSDPMPHDPDWTGGTVYRDERSLPVSVPEADVWAAIEGIGGDHGWYSFPLAWAVRGWFDRLMGGVGLRRGRRDPNRLAVGEAVDFWRVEALERGEMLRLRAEMKLPGEAWLEFRLDRSEGMPTVHQRALFIPRGLLGEIYWWSVYPFHSIVFGSMIRNIAAAARFEPVGSKTLPPPAGPRS